MAAHERDTASVKGPERAGAARPSATLPRATLSSCLPGPASPAPAGLRMAPASLGMNPAGLQTCGGGRAGPGPLPFSVESLLEAERGLDSEPEELREERPRGTAEPWAWFPTAARSSSPRKCPVARSGQREKPSSGPGSEDQRGKGAVALNFAT